LKNGVEEEEQGGEARVMTGEGKGKSWEEKREKGKDDEQTIDSTFKRAKGKRWRR
jgi:hypothetical protein